MQKINKIEGRVIPLVMNDVDTDLIIPADYLTSVSREGYGEHLFSRLKQNDPEFVFNQARFKGAEVLVAGDNFGCGSSREHAVWALQGAGIKAVIAESFADIFFNNSGKNGLLLIKQPASVIATLQKKAAAGDFVLSIDLELQTIIAEKDYSFEVDPFLKHCFMNGLDELDYILSHKQQITEFRHRQVNFN